MAPRPAFGLRPLTLGLLLVAWSCGNPTEPGPLSDAETLASFVVEAPREVEGGTPFDLAITATGSDGSEPFDYSGPVALSISGGTLSPDSVLMAGGTVTVSVQGHETTGPVEVTAAAGSASGSANIERVILRRLAGDPDDPAPAAIPAIEYDAAVATFSPDPEGPEGGELAHDVIAVQVEPSATVAEVNALMENAAAAIVGGHRGDDADIGMLVLHVPTQDHAALDAVIATVEASPAVRRVMKDMLIDMEIATTSTDSIAADWTWELVPAGGNWGLELIRAPQMWNVDASVEKSGATTVVQVIDAGFVSFHPDLSFEELGGGPEADHGTHVAGIIGAAFGNGVGIDGTTRFARLRGSPVGRARGDRSSLVQAFTTIYRIAQQDNPRVVNVSMGMPYDEFGVNPISSVYWQATLSRWGESLADFLRVLRDRDLAPLIVVSAGNDSNTATNQGIGEVEATFNSPFSYAGIALAQPEILVIESLDRAPAAPGGATRSVFSNIGGHLSGPGGSVMSTVTTGYDLKSGTSMATPHVAGLAAHLFAVEPTLTNAQVREILTSTSVEIDGGATAPRIDAFAALMDIDRVRGNDAVLRRMVDIDDGTTDGNQRTTVDGPFTNEDADGDGGVGDGSIDMADFRRFRDWLLDVENGDDVLLDGGLQHGKRDINRDGRIGTPAEENVYPRGDFNGDGRLHRTATAFVGGAIGAAVTDLEVLQRVYSDPEVSVGELPSLLNSGEVTVDASRFFQLEGVTGATLRIRRTSDRSLVETRTVTPATPIVLFTVPVDESGYDFSIEGRDADGSPLGEDAEWFSPLPGDDEEWFPTATDALVVELTVPGQAATDAPFPILARAGVRDPQGAITYRAGILVSFQATGGSVTPAQATTEADGYVSVEGEFGAGASQVVVTATASQGDLEDAVDIGTVAAAGSGNVLVRTMLNVYPTQAAVASAAAYDDAVSSTWARDSCEDGAADRDWVGPLELDFTVPHAFTWSCSASVSRGSASGASSVTIDASLHTTTTPDSVLQRIEWSGTGSASASGNHRVDPPILYSGAGQSQGAYVFEVVLDVTDTTTLTVDGNWAAAGMTHVSLTGSGDAPDWTWIQYGTVEASSISDEITLPAGEYVLQLQHGVGAEYDQGVFYGDAASGSVSLTLVVGS